MAVLFVVYTFAVYLAHQNHRDDPAAVKLLPLVLVQGVVGVTAGLLAAEIVLGGGDVLATSQAPYLLLFAIVLLALAALLPISHKLRQAAAKIIGRSGQFMPEQPLHMTAAVIGLTFLAYTFVSFLLGGGLEGLSSALTADVRTSVWATVAQMVIFLAAACYGVGLFLRRSPTQTMLRLGLRIPTPRDVWMGIAVGVSLLAIGIVYALFWERLFTPQEIAEQTQASEALALAFSTLPLALLLAVCAAIGEEILLRGALQPVFGNVLTSLFFALLHTQYLITPGLLLLFGVSLGFGWLRQRHSTSAAIIAHFVYNFIPLLLLTLTTTGV